jgi:hypothetical protein
VLDFQLSCKAILKKSAPPVKCFRVFLHAEYSRRVETALANQVLQA